MQWSCSSVEETSLRIRCTCGSTIFDQKDSLPHKALFVSDQLIELMIDKFLEHAHNLGRVNEGRLTLEEWSRQYFLDSFPVPTSAEELLGEIIASLNVRFWREIYECVECRSIVATANDGSLVFYSRDTDEGGRLLEASDSAEVLMSPVERRDAGLLETT